MKALYFNQHGDIDNLKFGDFPNPVEDSESAIIRVLYSSINHLDLWILNGWKGLNLDLPHIGGADIVGKVESINSSLDIKKNDLVCMNPGYIKNSFTDKPIALGKENISKGYEIIGENCKGGFATFVKVPLTSIHKIPKLDDSKLIELAGSLLVGLTSYRMLEQRAKLIAGETVLIVGAGGGVNSFTIKLAKHLGAKVIALTGTEEKAAQCSAIGADETINYNDKSEWFREVKNLTNGEGADIVIDNVGSKTINESIRSCANEGRIITVGNTSGPNLNIDNRQIFAKQISIIGSTMGSFLDFKAVLEIMIKNDLYAPIHKIIPLEEGKTGYQLLKDPSRFGKIVFKNN